MFARLLNKDVQHFLIKVHPKASSVLHLIVPE